MTSKQELNNRLILQTIEPGMTVPTGFPPSGLFLLNLSQIMDGDVWDNYGTKELSQSRRLRNFSTRIIAIADALEELGSSLKAYPDTDDYEMEDYDQPWEDLMAEMSDTFTDGYKKITELVAFMAEESIGDFMD